MNVYSRGGGYWLSAIGYRSGAMSHQPTATSKSKNRESGGLEDNDPRIASSKDSHVSFATWHARPNSCLGFDGDMADAADDVVAKGFVFFDRQERDRIGLVVRTEDKIVFRHLDIFHRASAIFADGIHVLLVLAIRRK